MTPAEQLKTQAVNEANQRKQRDLDLQKKQQALELEIAKIKAEREFTSLSYERLRDFVPMNGRHFNCPRCWIGMHEDNPLKAVNGTMNTDRFRCDQCGFDFEYTA